MKLKISFDNEATNPYDRMGFCCNIKGGSKKKVLHYIDMLKREVERTPGQDKLEG